MWTIHSFTSVGSTQDIARQYLAEGYPLPFAILADEQTAGRGRSGNQWVSLPVGNLYCSICPSLTGGVSLKDAGQYSFLTAVALQETLDSFGVSSVQNKWPNDLLVDGRKIAGILLESNGNAEGHLNSLIIGVGVNLAAAPAGAVAVSDINGLNVQPDIFLTQLLENIQTAIVELGRNGFAPLRRKWLDRAYGLGMKMRVRLPRENFTGTFSGIESDGSLLVIEEGELQPRRIYSGEVFFEPTHKV